MARAIRCIVSLKCEPKYEKPEMHSLRWVVPLSSQYSWPSVGCYELQRPGDRALKQLCELSQDLFLAFASMNVQRHDSALLRSVSIDKRRQPGERVAHQVQVRTGVQDLAELYFTDSRLAGWVAEAFQAMANYLKQKLDLVGRIGVDTPIVIIVIFIWTIIGLVIKNPSTAVKGPGIRTSDRDYHSLLRFGSNHRTARTL